MDLGIHGQDHLEFFSCSTASLIGTILHWQKKLPTKEAKASAGGVLALLLEKSLGGDKRTIYINIDNPLGSVATSGVAIEVTGATIPDASALSDNFPIIKSTLKRTVCVSASMV